MDVMTAAFGLVRDYPGGAVALAPVLKKNPATLSHEVSPRYPLAKLGLADAVTLSLWANDRRIASAFASELGCMLVPLPDIADDGTTFESIARIAREFADLSEAAATAVADGSVTENELARVQREASQLVAAVEATVARIAKLHAKRSSIEFVEGTA